MPRHMCRLEVVNNLEKALRQHNHLYKSTRSNPEVYRHDAEDLTTVVEEDGNAIAQARSRIANLTEHEPDTATDGDDGSGLCATETVLLQTVMLNDLERCETGVHNSLSRGQDRNTFVAQRSSKLLDRRDPRYLEYLFPHLFPFGIGGLSEARMHKYSKRAIICHLLRLSSQRFAKDQLFKLLTYDLLATTNVLSSMFIRATVEPSCAVRTASISIEEVQAALANKRKKKTQYQEGNGTCRLHSRLKGKSC